MIAIIDYGSGNTFSVYNALDFLGHEVVITRDPKEISQASHIVLPGVGTFGNCMAQICDYNLPEILYHEVIENKKPFLGICVGMQVLASIGLEKGSFKGLGWIDGTVKQMDVSEYNLSLPHVGWNDIKIVQNNPLFKGIKKDLSFYFVHSYHFVPKDTNVIEATTTYGIEFVAAILKDNIFATQFHPEKSQKNGLTILDNFAEWDGVSC